MSSVHELHANLKCFTALFVVLIRLSVSNDLKYDAIRYVVCLCKDIVCVYIVMLVVNTHTISYK